MATLRRMSRIFNSLFMVFTVIIWSARICDSKVMTVHTLKRNYPRATSQEVYRHFRHQMQPSVSQQQFTPPPHASHYESLSVVMETSNKRENRFIQVTSSPSIYPPDNVLLVEYECLPGETAGIEVDVWTVYNQHFHPVRHRWKCSQHSKHARKVFQTLQLPDGMVYQPDYLNRDVQLIESIELSVWILDTDLLRSKKTGYYDLADAKAKYNIQVLPMYRRPRKRHHSFACLTWESEIMLKYNHIWNGILQCNKEEEVIDLLTFPVALHSGHHGVSREIPSYKEPGLKMYIEDHDPKFTISAYIYILEPCKHSMCSIIHRKTQYTNRYVSPLIFLRNDGQVFIQIETDKKSYMSMINNIKLPLKEWMLMVYVQDGRKWSVQFYPQSLTTTTTHLVGRSVFTNDVHYNETDAFYHLGGSSAIRSFSGFMVEAKLWRHQALNPDKVPVRPVDQLNYTTDISNYYSQCDHLHVSMETVFNNYQLKLQHMLKNKTSANVLPLLANDNVAEGQQHLQPSCDVWQQPAPRRQQKLWRLLQQSALVNTSYVKTHEWLGHQLYQHVQEKLQTEGLGQIHVLIPWLKQASCYGNMDATSFLATIYNTGLGLQSNDSKALIYLLVAAQGGSRLALTALANKHHLGISEVNADMDYAFHYYYHVAQETVLDRTKHSGSDISFEAVRLTDEHQLQTQTGETGDYFQWLKHQAKQGVADAQINLARMYYHGTAGVQRDMEAAAELYRLNAEQNPADPIAQYDYAVLHLRGQGVEKDEQKGLEYLNKSAELGHGPAYTALGWYQLNMERNDTAAADYFEKGDAKGHRDAAHNLGYMYLVGRYPGKPVDRMKAFEYYLKAAKADHWDSGLKVAELYNQGNEHMDRDDILATAWARYVAEKNRDVAWVLRWGLDAHIKGSWSESLIYYAVAAEAGLEIGQYNLAYLCEENYDGVAERYVDIDCAWKYWNLAARSSYPHLTSILKVADYHWYGYRNVSNTEKAVKYYIQAAETKQPHALFNLANLIENGIQVKDEILEKLGVPSYIFTSKNNMSKVMELYRLCRDSSEDAYFPCGLALLNLQLRQFWKEHNLSLQVVSACSVGLLTLYAVAVFFGYLGGGNMPKDLNDNNSNNNSDTAEETVTDQPDGRSEQPSTTQESLISVPATGTTSTTTTATLSTTEDARSEQPPTTQESLVSVAATGATSNTTTATLSTTENARSEPAASESTSDSNTSSG